MRRVEPDSSVPLTLLLAASAGYVFSRRAMSPVAAITHKANEIEARRLSERIPVPECRDEIRELAGTLNGLLDRLEAAFKSSEAFVADASHQLKTPLTILKGELEVFRQTKRSSEELEEWLQSARQEIDYLIGMVQDLLLLAQSDSRNLVLPTHVFRMDEKLIECVTRLSALAEKRRVQLLVNLLPESENSQQFELQGDTELVRALIENLVENAIKYSPEGKKVYVTLSAADKSVVLEVRDEGLGIEPDALAHLFDRFYRADATRMKVIGTGLGLPIVKSVATLHGGMVEVRNARPSGAVFTVRLPRPA